MLAYSYFCFEIRKISTAGEQFIISCSSCSLKLMPQLRGFACDAWIRPGIKRLSFEEVVVCRHEAAFVAHVQPRVEVNIRRVFVWHRWILNVQTRPLCQRMVRDERFSVHGSIAVPSLYEAVTILSSACFSGTAARWSCTAPAMRNCECRATD